MHVLHVCQSVIQEATRSYRHTSICDWCFASKSSTLLNYANFSPDAFWRTTLCHTTDPGFSPWRTIEGFSKDRQLFDCMHILHLGVLRDVVGSCVVEMLTAGDLHRFVGLPLGAGNDLVLHRFTSLAREWAKQRKFDLSIKPLTESTLNFSASQYASLESTIKAARTRVLFEYVCKVCLDIVAWSGHSEIFCMYFLLDKVDQFSTNDLTSSG